MFLVFRPWFLLLVFTVIDARVTAGPTNGSARAVLEARARSAFRVADAPVGGMLDPLTRDPAPRSRVRIFLPDTSGVAAGQPMPAADEIRPLPGYRAPLTGPTDAKHPATLPSDAPPALRATAGWIEAHLATDGLLPTLAAVLDRSGPARFATNGAAGLDELRAVGLPVDWLERFADPGADGSGPTPVVARIARRLAGGEPVAAVAASLTGARFRARPSDPGFSAALEDGTQEPSLVRVQIGGGLRRNRLIPGSGLDVAGHLVAALPSADFLAAVPETMVPALRIQALGQWGLRRPGQVTLLPARAALSAWAQDNGKAGTLAGAPATLAPRYASRESSGALFMPADSEVMLTAQAAGHRVVASPLLFQGGDLLVVRDPATGRRVLLLGASEIARNVALGLTPAQVEDAFRVELAADETVVVPTVSYHLDLDVTPRVIGGKLCAFVNDPVAAAHWIARAGAEVLRSAGASAVPAGWPADGEVGVPAAVRAAVETRRGADGRFPGAVAGRFAAGPQDNAEYQLHAFLLALDVLSAADPRADSAAGEDPSARAAWRSILVGLAEQAALFRGRGWQVVLVPSLPDTSLGLNYLNGLQTPTKYLMPAIGGRLAALDAAASAVFRSAMGPAVAVIPIPTLDSQWHHGALHCLLSVYPAGR